MDASIATASAIYTATPYNLRPAEATDEGVLLQIYASTRTEEMALVSWTDEQKDAFLRMQFDAQTKHYLIYYPSANYYIILQDGKTVGRLILESSENSLLIMDIALLPEYRNRGMGTAILHDLMKKARQDNVPLVLRVEFFNPAIRLYERLGFVTTRQVNTVYHEMVWRPTLD
jgi:ribosomal protein S18 acetylase RimI-like enzyme